MAMRRVISVNISIISKYLQILLKISKLYGVSINDILEPKIQPQRITDFETTRSNIGRIRNETVENMQNQIISMVNLQAVEKI
jgi:hypothetical protein